MVIVFPEMTVFIALLDGAENLVSRATGLALIRAVRKCRYGDLAYNLSC